MSEIEYTPKGLHDKIRSLLRIIGEVLYDETHILNISDDEEIDQFSQVSYRVYHGNKCCFDVIREYSSEDERGGGGFVYSFHPDVWDGFEGITPVTIDEAYKIINDVFKRNKNGKAYDISLYKSRKNKH